MLSTGDLRERLATAHLCLGVFGCSAKAASVIPYKVHQALASNRTVITRRSPELSPLVDAELGLFDCEPGDGQALAERILEVGERLRRGWLPSTRRIYDREFSHARLRERLAGIVS